MNMKRCCFYLAFQQCFCSSVTVEEREEERQVDWIKKCLVWLITETTKSVSFILMWWIHFLSKREERITCRLEKWNIHNFSVETNYGFRMCFLQLLPDEELMPGHVVCKAQLVERSLETNMISWIYNLQLLIKKKWIYSSSPHDYWRSKLLSSPWMSCISWVPLEGKEFMLFI